MAWWGTERLEARAWGPAGIATWILSTVRTGWALVWNRMAYEGRCSAKVEQLATAWTTSLLSVFTSFSHFPLASTLSSLPLAILILGGLMKAGHSHEVFLNQTRAWLPILSSS